MSKDILIVCFCVILYKGRILLLKRAPNDSSFPNTWWLPGGHLEEGETLEQGLIREVFEETDILLSSRQVNLVKKGTSAGGKPLFLFVAEVSSPLVALKDGEHTNFVWVAPCDLLQYNKTKVFIHYMQEALMFQSSQYGLSTLSSPGSVYSEAVMTSATGPVIKRGVVSNKAMVNPYSSPIVYKKNCATCSGDGHSSRSNLGSLYVGQFKEPVVYGNPLGFVAEASTTMKVVYALLAMGVAFGGYTVVKKRMAK